MNRIHGPSPFLGGLSPVRLMHTPREKTLEEKTEGKMSIHPGTIFRSKDQMTGKVRRTAALPELETDMARRKRRRLWAKIVRES